MSWPITLCENFGCPGNIRKLRVSRLIFRGKTSSSYFRSISWDKVCKRKAEGCLGINDSPSMNLSLLIKLASRIMSDPNSLLAQVLRSKFEKGNGWGNIQKVANPSFLWSSKGIQSLNRNG